MHLERAANRPLRIVLVQSRYAKDGHDGVAREFLDGAAEPFDDGSHASEVRMLNALYRFGIEALAKRCRSDEVAEENRDELALARDAHKGKRSTRARRTPGQPLPTSSSTSPQAPLSYLALKCGRAAPLGPDAPGTGFKIRPGRVFQIYIAHR